MADKHIISITVVYTNLNFKHPCYVKQKIFFAQRINPNDDIIVRMWDNYIDNLQASIKIIGKNNVYFIVRWSFYFYENQRVL